MSELRTRIDRLSDSQKGDALEYYLSDSRYNRAVKVLEKTIDDLMTKLEGTNIAENLDDGKDKTFDRFHKIMDNLLDFTMKLEESKMSALNVEKARDFTKKSASNGILAMIKEQREKDQ